MGKSSSKSFVDAGLALWFTLDGRVLATRDSGTFRFWGVASRRSTRAGAAITPQRFCPCAGTLATNGGDPTRSLPGGRPFIAGVCG